MTLTKDQKLFYSIGEVTERYGIKPSTLHFWEKQFSELKPRRNKKGNRFYTEDDIVLLDMIYFLTKEKGFTLKGAREKIKADHKKTMQQAQLYQTLQKAREFLVSLRNELEKKKQ